MFNEMNRLEYRGRKISLKSKAFLTTFIFMFILSAVSFRSCSAETNWVGSSTIRDLTDSVTLQSGQPLIAGHSYNITTTINVPYTQTQSDFQVALYALMGQQGTQYWYLLSSYAGYDATKFTAGLQTISFNQVEGPLSLSVLFSVPQSFTVTTGNLNQHFIKSNVNFVTVRVVDRSSGTVGATVGTLQGQVSDQAIQEYLASYSQKSTYISQGKIDSAYSNLVKGILDQAQAIYAIGLPENALAVLNNINTSNFPPPPNNILNIVLIVGVIAFAAIAALTAVMYLRAKSKLGDLNGMVSEVQKDLAALEVSAAQFDRKLADRGRSLKERLGESI